MYLIKASNLLVLVTKIINTAVNDKHPKTIKKAGKIAVSADTIKEIPSKSLIKRSVDFANFDFIRSGIQLINFCGEYIQKALSNNIPKEIKIIINCHTV